MSLVVKVIRKATAEEIEGLNHSFTTHFLEQRLERYKQYKHLITDKYVLNLICDTGHANGYEIHRISSKAICEIYNLKSKRLITIKALRTGQIYGYYNAIDKTPPKYLIDQAILNVSRNLNNI